MLLAPIDPRATPQPCSLSTLQVDANAAPDANMSPMIDMISGCEVEMSGAKTVAFWSACVLTQPADLTLELHDLILCIFDDRGPVPNFHLGVP